jgi:hypothetical protein
MTRRRVLFGLLLASAVLACVAGWLWIVNAGKPTRAKFEQVKEGMSREDVIRTVGCPPGNYSSGRTDLAELELNEWWLCDDAYLIVRFDHTDTADYVRVLDIEARPPTLTERIRSWLCL